MIDIKGILGKLRQRYPFLLVDRIIEYKEFESVVAIKNVTINEPYFVGHFEGEPVMPGVLMIEAMAQAGAFLFPDSDGGYLVEVQKAKFKKFVQPGDQLRMCAKLENKISHYATASIQSFVDDKLVAQCEVKYYIK